MTEREQAQRIQKSLRTLVRRIGLSERSDVECCCGMTVAQAAALEALRCCGPCRPSELSGRLGIAPSTLTRNLKRLEERGWVAKTVDPEDGRATRLQLTEPGRAAASEVAKQEADFALDVLRRVPEARRGDVAETLEVLLEAICEATRACCGDAFDHLMEEPRGSAQCCS